MSGIDDPKIKRPTGLETHSALSGLGVLASEQTTTGVQACRPEDRAMLQTEAGGELLRCATAALQAGGVPADMVPAKGQFVEGFLCRAWGETDLPSAALCGDMTAVRQFLIDEWLGDESSPDWEGDPILPDVMDELASYNWADESNMWQTEFEIGGISVERVTFLLAAAAGAPTKTDSVHAPTFANGQWNGVPLSNFPELQEMVRRKIADGTLSVGCSVHEAAPQASEVHRASAPANAPSGEGSAA